MNFVIIAGPNGAGKSTSAPRLLRDTLQVVHYVNADAIAQGLSAFRPDSAAIPAGRAALRQLQRLADEGVDFAFETTLAGRGLARFVDATKRKGYRVHVAFFWLASAEMAIARVRERVRSGGHDIPEETIRRRYVRGQQQFFRIYQSMADAWQMYDNSSIGAPRLMENSIASAPIERAVRLAVFDALREHKRNGNPVAEWRDGQVVWVAPEDIVIPDE